MYFRVNPCIRACSRVDARAIYAARGIYACPPPQTTTAGQMTRAMAANLEAREHDDGGRVDDKGHGVALIVVVEHEDVRQQHPRARSMGVRRRAGCGPKPALARRVQGWIGPCTRKRGSR